MSKGYRSQRTPALLLALGLLVFATACGNKKKVIASPPTPSNNNSSNTGSGGDRPVIASFTVEPTSIEVGQAVTMRWSVSNATDVSIDQGVGAVQSQGSRQLSPRRSTSYTLTANGPGGSDTRSVNVTVSNPPPPLTGNPANNPTLSGAEILQQQAQDAYFDYDKNELRQDARDALTHDAELLRRIFAQDPNFVVILEGHCDERGSGEFNLALGDRRANSAHDFLVQLGIPAARLKTVSYGKERPQCTDATEECWQKNRRAHLAGGQ